MECRLARDRLRKAQWVSPLVAGPAAFWFGFFLVVPLAIVLVTSLARRGTYGGIVAQFSLANYARVLDPIYLSVVARSVGLAVVTTGSCLLIGYPMAFFVARARPKLRWALLILIVTPFWTNFVVRAYAVRSVLHSLEGWGWELLNTPTAVWIGMVGSYLPFMVLPLFVALEKFDFTLLEAARDLGATPARAVRAVLLPGTRAGIITGSILVFTPALGEFVIPDILGGARTLLLGNLITDQFLKARDWPFGSALSVLLIALIAALLIAASTYGGREV